jgi:hypothetical protein
MLEAVIYGLIWLAVLVLVVYVVLWVLSTLGINLPPQVVTIIWVIVALLALLILVQTVLPNFTLAPVRRGALDLPFLVG